MPEPSASVETGEPVSSPMCKNTQKFPFHHLFGHFHVHIFIKTIVLGHTDRRKSLSTHSVLPLFSAETVSFRYWAHWEDLPSSSDSVSKGPGKSHLPGKPTERHVPSPVLPDGRKTQPSSSPGISLMKIRRRQSGKDKNKVTLLLI